MSPVSGGKMYWTPCSPGADGAVAMKLMDATGPREYTGTARLQYMGVSKNRGTPKWMVYNGKPY